MKTGEKHGTSDTIDAMAESVTQDHEQRVLHEIPQKIDALESSKSNVIKDLLQNVKLAFAMLRDKRYVLSWKTKTLLVAGLLYFLLPSDLTPDFVPFIGYIDDAAVMTAIFKRIAHEVMHYKSLLEH